MVGLDLRRWAGRGFWSAGLVVAVVWAGLGHGGVQGRGYGFAPAVLLSPTQDGRIAAVHIELHALVVAGAPLVQMDPSLLEGERAALAARLESIRAEVSSEQAQAGRRFAEGAQDAALDRAVVSSNLQEDRALLDALRERLAVEQGLAATGATSTYAVDEWHRQIRVVEARVRAGEYALSVASQAASTAVDRQAAAPGGNAWRVQTAERQLELLDRQIEQLQLVSSIDGQVTRLVRQPGEVVRAGDPVLEVRRADTSDVLAYVHPSQVGDLTPGADASVVRSSGGIVPGTLTSVGMGPQLMPEYLWTNPSYPEYGVPVRIALDGAVGPDERVTVRM